MAKATSTPSTPKTAERHAKDVTPMKAAPDELNTDEQQVALLVSPVTLLTMTQLHAFHQASSSSDKLAVLVEALHVQHYSANPRSSIWIDYLFGILCFAHDNAQLSDEKALVWLQVAHQVFEFATTSNTTEFPSIESVYKEFREHIRVNSVAVPASPSSLENPPPIDIRFSAAEVARIVTFMSGTFFRHLSAYQYVYEHTRESFTRQVEIMVEVPMPATALSAAQLIE